MPLSSAHVVRRPLIVATSNPGKLREFRALLADLPFDLHSLGELGVAAPEETGTSFLENAMLKARHAAAAAAAGLCGASALDAAALADDSGLEVDALDGAPGIFSARYAGAGADDAANNAKLSAALAGIPLERRTARYRCALVFVPGAQDLPGAQDSPALIAEGVWEGYILEAPRGSGGFGYDPYFWLRDLGLTAAQLDLEEKNRLSHRGIAMRSLHAQLVVSVGQTMARELEATGRERAVRP
jgi:XTP/dITP diphosphohydrolase